MEWFIPEWLVALSLTLFVLDIFFMTEFMSWGGVLALSVWLTWRIDASFKWAILIFCISFTGFAFIYWFFLKNTIGAVVRRVLQGKSPKEALYAVVGAKGRVKNIDNKLFLDIDGELWPISSKSPCASDGAFAQVLAVENGALVIALEKT